MSAKAKREYLRTLHGHYRRAGRAERQQMLTECCRVTGYHRKYVIRVLNGPVPAAAGVGRRPRGVTYGAAVMDPVRLIWAAAGYPWAVRLKALLPLWLPWARRRLPIAPAVERQLLRISARQIDRRLASHKRQLQARRYGRTKPGPLLKHPIPLKTDHWDVTAPGYTELDLVAPGGDRADGEFAHSLNVSDIHTGWTETVAVLGKSQERVRAALESLRHALPFRLRGIDSDNGSEFINEHRYRYCQALEIQFTRGRPYKKDDNAHIEQKNWTHVRKLVGYLRYDTPAAVTALNALYRQDLRLFQNLFLPSVKLRAKQRVGARVRRQYDAPQTPLDRLRACPTVDPRTLLALTRQRARLDPFQLSRTIDTNLERLFALASTPSPVAPAAAAPPAPAAAAPPARPTRHRPGYKPNFFRRRGSLPQLHRRQAVTSQMAR